MDELGFYCLWTAEHHFQHEGYEVFPNLILLSTWLATQTQQLKFGCAFNVLPMWHPVRLAEDYAMADIITGGRVIMGVGRGYHTREVESFGAPAARHGGQQASCSRSRWSVLMKCFHEESFSPPRQALHGPAGRDVPGLRAERGHLRAAPDPPARRDLAADRERQDASSTSPRAASRAWSR